MSIKENVVMRLVGLFIFIAPKRGAEFLADLHVATAARVARNRGTNEL